MTADTVIDGAMSIKGWNRYMYVGGNPIMYSDPTGNKIRQIGNIDSHEYEPDDNTEGDPNSGPSDSDPITHDFQEDTEDIAYKGYKKLSHEAKIKIHDLVKINKNGSIRHKGKESSKFGHRAIATGKIILSGKKHKLYNGVTSHAGLDTFRADKSIVVALDDGIVIKSGYSSFYGNRMEVEHGDGSISTYSHLNQRNRIVGDPILRNQQIGTQGKTGSSTNSSHLHQELKLKGKKVNIQNVVWKTKKKFKKYKANLKKKKKAAKKKFQGKLDFYNTQAN